MKKNWLKGVFCLALALTMLVGSALAATEVTTAQATGTTVSVADGKYTVEVSGLSDGTQYALLQVKTTAGAGDTTAADLLDNTYKVGESTILYIDQAEASGGKVTFTSFQPIAQTTSLFVLGGGATAQTVGAALVPGVTVSGTVTAKEGANGAASVTVAAGDATTTANLTNGEGSYTLDGVATDATSLTVSAGDNKFVDRTYTIDASAEVTQAVALWAKGDVVGNGDGVKINDVNALFNHFMNASKTTSDKKITDEYALAVGDVVGSGDGIKINDVNALFNHVMGREKLW